MRCKEQHWFAVDPPGHYTQCSKEVDHEGNEHEDQDGRWWQSYPEQPMPIATSGEAILDLVIEDIKQRDAIGVQRYGTRLQSRNGRDALQDAYEEALDLAFYLRQLIEERKK